MIKTTTYLLSCLVIMLNGFGQKSQSDKWQAGFTSIELTDSSRFYKPDTNPQDPLHHRPIDLDVCYPSSQIVDEKKPMAFGDLFKLLEQRANTYQDETDYTGFTAELAQFFLGYLGIEGDGSQLLDVATDSYENLKLAKGQFPLLMYMAGFNGMGFENYKLLEELAQNGFVVVSISSIGRYPGDMTNELGDTMEQVYDAEFALDFLTTQAEFNIDVEKIGVIGTSWGGMSGAILLNRNEKIKAMVSWDGSDNHFYGDYTDNNLYANDATWEDNDEFIKEIYSTQFTDI